MPLALPRYLMGSIPPTFFLAMGSSSPFSTPWDCNLHTEANGVHMIQAQPDSAM